VEGPIDSGLVKVLVWAAVAWFLIFGLVLLQIAPHFPASALEWALLFVAGPPLYVLGEALGSWLFSAESGHQISPKGFSVLRIAYALVIMLAFVALASTIAGMLKGGA
jgi:hypothetical protein